MPQRRDDTGSMAIELVVIAPVLLVLVMLLYLYGRLAQVQGLVEATARDGARAATQSRSNDEAVVRVRDIRDDLVGRAPSSCATNADVTVEPAVFRAGDAVTVVVACTVDLSDLGVPGAPGTIRIRRSFTSMLDPYRGVEEQAP
jgi:Flp pilus assembly protein TadG